MLFPDTIWDGKKVWLNLKEIKSIFTTIEEFHSSIYLILVGCPLFTRK